MAKRDYSTASQDLIGNLTRNDSLLSKVPEMPKKKNDIAQIEETKPAATFARKDDAVSNNVAEMTDNAVDQNAIDTLKKSVRRRKKPMERKFQIAMGEELYQELSEEADAEGLALNTYIRNLLTKRKQLQNK